MFKRLWRKFIRALFVGGVATALLGGGSAFADDKDDLRALKEQLELQKKQIEQLQQQLGTLARPTAQPAGDAAAGGELPAVKAADKDGVEKIVGDYLKRKDDEKKAQEAAAKAKVDAEGFKVGSDLSMTTRWNIANGVTFSTPNKDFVSHIGVRFQLDDVWWGQSNGLRPSSQIGDLQDGVFFRRTRPSWDGTAWEVIEWNVELALEQIQNDVIDYDEVWVGLMNLPVVGTVRIGHVKTPQGFEGDMVSSSKAMTFLERSAYTDAFYQNFSTGLWFGRSMLDQRVTYSAEIYRQDNDNGINSPNNAVDFGDGAYGYGVRLTALPVWQNDGRCWMHVGLSYNFRDSENPNASSGGGGYVPKGGTAAGGGAGVQGGLVGPSLAEFRARPQLRDAIGDYGGTNGNNSQPVGLTGNGKRIVDTGPVACPSNQVIGTEFCYVRGPFSVQAEWAAAAMNDAVTTSKTNVTAGTKAGTHVGTPWFTGGYVQMSYFLTGENRVYDRRLGREGSTYIASPYTPFWLTRREDGGYTYGRGAWELAARWNYLDLNQGVIQGGRTNALELGVNWYLTNNLKIQGVYLWQNRYDLAPGQVKGDIDGFGIRTQFFF